MVKSNLCGWTWTRLSCRRILWSCHAASFRLGLLDFPEYLNAILNVISLTRRFDNEEPHGHTRHAMEEVHAKCSLDLSATVVSRGGRIVAVACQLPAWF